MRDIILIALGAMLGAAILAFPMYKYGMSHGKRLEQAEILQRSVEADNSRREIDAEVSSRGDPDLCRSIGLRVDQIAECVRRVEEINAKR